MSVVDTAADDALGTDDLTDMLARLSRREVCAAELRAAALDRAVRAQGLNALTRSFDRPVATEVAIPADAPLAGIPTLLKDNEQLTGHPTSSGSRAVADHPARRCSPIVGDLLALGLDPIGCTTMPEFGLTASTESTRFGATRNPWATGRSVGGSSGGSAALVAAGVVPLAHSNDGGGSSRIPASCAGLVGMKPSRGRLPDALAVDRLPVQITAQGVLTRSVRDTALYYAVAERLRPAPGLPPIGDPRGPGRARLRVGVCLSAVHGLPVDDATRDTVRRTAQLCEALGHDVSETGPPVGDGFAEDFLRYWYFMGFVLHRGGRRIYGRGFRPDLVERFTRGLSAHFVAAADRFGATLRRLRSLARHHESAFGQVDVLLTPVTGHAAPPIGHMGPDVPFRTHLARLVRFACMTPVQNVSGSPAISLPLGRSQDGVPIGVQLAAPFGHERRLLELALELEQASPWPHRPVALPARAGPGRVDDPLQPLAQQHRGRGQRLRP